MGDSEKNAPLPGQTFSAPESSPFWIPLAIGVALVAVVVAAVVFFGRKSPDPNAHTIDPYVAKLQVSELHMSMAENFAGGSVIYTEGKITNTGEKKVTGASVQVIFKNSLGEIVQQETLPVMVLLTRVPNVDYGPLKQASLSPAQTRDFRLTLEHVSADWDRQPPQVRVVWVSY
jgi:hypothetical protein